MGSSISHLFDRILLDEVERVAASKIAAQGNGMPALEYPNDGIFSVVEEVGRPSPMVILARFSQIDLHSMQVGDGNYRGSGR